ncbi:MAG: hypothetical protein Q4Q53_03585 [Methanocorpusculum sp.]|nr:hypothetical protein [Methanocorpusculum sp.]
MHVSEGNLTQQYICDYLTLKDITHDSIVLQNLFLHRMSVDGGFHARVLTAVLGHEEDREILLALLNEYAAEKSGKMQITNWLSREYDNAKKAGDKNRQTAAAAILQSHLTGINQTAEIVSSARSNIPQSAWQLETRKITVNEINNPDMYLARGRRPIWNNFPLDDYAAYLARAENLTDEEICDCVLCASAAWFSTLSRDEKIIWLNIPRVTQEEWSKFTAPLLSSIVSAPALKTALWLHLSGNLDAALDLYANITLAYKNTSAEKPAFEMMAEILSEFGDYDYAFESYKDALLLNSSHSRYENARGLLNLCEVGEKLGENMSEYYSRISKIAGELPQDEKIRLFSDLASSSRKKHDYKAEYSYLEKIISDESADEKIFASASARITELNDYLNASGEPDINALTRKDEDEKSAELTARGDTAYFGFDPVCAMFWYNRSNASPEKKFTAAVAAGLYEAALEYADTHEKKAVVLAIEKESVPVIAYELIQAVTDAVKNHEDISLILEPVYLILSPKERVELTEFVVDRTTRDDEKALAADAVGRVYVSLGMADEARSVFRTALRSNPSNQLRAIIFSDLGSLEFDAGVYDSSCDAYRSAVKINEKFPAAWAGIARAGLVMKNIDEAKAAADKAVYYNSSSESYRMLREEIYRQAEEK